MSRHVQLSRTVLQPLLSTFRRNDLQANMKKAVKEPDNVDDPPIEDTASEDEQQHLSSEHLHVDSSDDDMLAGNIKRTTFTSKTGSRPAIVSGNVSGRWSVNKEEDTAGLAGKTSQRRSARQTGAKKRTKSNVGDDGADVHDPSMKTKRTKLKSYELAGEVGAHMRSASMWPKRSAIQRGYGKKSQSSTPQSSLQTSRHISESSSPEKRPKFKSRTFSPVDSSPVAELKLSQSGNPADDESSPLSEVPSSGEISDPPRALDVDNKKYLLTPRPRRKGKDKATDFSPEPISQKPQFRMPDGYNNYAPSAELVDLDVALETPTVERRRQLDPGLALCPMCDEEVDEDLLNRFSNGERMKLVRQAKFCRLHKRVSAQKTWDEKGYPVVDWTSLERRIKGHHDFLKSIIMGSGSHFGDLLKENIRTGQARTLLKTDEYLTPGYYGLQGMSLMTEQVTDTFSNLLRKRAPLDTRISGRGYTGFVQSVLVPELAVKLIQEDLMLGEDQAREVMKESRAVGEILNDEKRQSQSQARAQMHHESQEERHEDMAEENSDQSDDDASVLLKIEQAADSVSDLSSPPSYSQRPTSAKVQSQNVDDSGSDESLESLGGRKTRKDQASMRKQDVPSSPRRASPSSKDNKNLATFTTEVDDSDDLSSLDSFGELFDPADDRQTL